MTGASAVRRTTTTTAVIAAALVVTVAVSACSPAAPPATSPSATDTVDVAALDTGPYATTPSPPFGAAGDNLNAQRVMDSQRLGGVVTPPWEVNPKLTLLGNELNVAATGRMPNVEALRNALPQGLPEIAERNGYLAGFSTYRVAPAEGNGTPPRFWSLQNIVMRFPDDASAAAAATELAASYPAPPGALGPRREITLRLNPDATAFAFDLDGAQTAVASFTAYRSLVLNQYAVMVPDPPVGLSAENLVFSTLTSQKKALDTFTPTPIDQLRDLPMDPSGWLLARTLGNPTGAMPGMIGVWAPKGWLNFEEKPLEASAMLTEAGVDWVGQRLATVYRTRNADTAEAMLKIVVDTMRATRPAEPTAPVPGLPRARCFERPDAQALAETAQSWRRLFWHFKCAAAVDRFVFTVYAADLKDAQQRISAQWRILAGK